MVAYIIIISYHKRDRGGCGVRVPRGVVTSFRSIFVSEYLIGIQALMLHFLSSSSSRPRNHNSNLQTTKECHEKLFHLFMQPLSAFRLTTKNNQLDDEQYKVRSYGDPPKTFGNVRCDGTDSAGYCNDVLLWKNEFDITCAR